MGKKIVKVKEGQTLQLEIIGIGRKGDGIARTKDGFAVIVPNANKGQKVEVRITKIYKTFAFGELVED